MIVVDRKTCDRWIAQAPLGDPVTACGAITQLIESLEDRPPKKPDAYLEILECLRRPIMLTVEALAYLLNGRALPLTEGEAQGFEAGCQLYGAYGRAYRVLIRMAHSEAEPTLAQSLPLMLARAAECSCELMILHYRARREIDTEHWHELNELYRLAESLKMASASVAPASERTQSCSECYVRALLMSLATPYGMTPRSIEWTRRWVRRWAGKVVLSSVAGARDCVAVNLASDFAPRARMHEAEPGELLRFLDLSGLRRSVKSRIRALEQGEDPHALGLGSEGTPEELTETLRTLYQQWFDTPIARQFKRRLVSSRAEVVGSFTSVHAAMCDTPPVPKVHEWELSRAEWENLYITGRRPSYKEAAAPAIPERWDLLDESAMGFRLRRRGSDLRLLHRQLVAVRVQGSSRFILAEIRWIIVGIDSTLTMGVRNLPGLADAGWVKPANGTEYREAFMLPAGSSEPASLVLPVGMFKPELRLELKGNEAASAVRLKSLLCRGQDFDRVAYSVVS